MFVSAADAVIVLLKEFGYPDESEGVCHGLARLAQRAHRLAQFQRYIERMKIIHTAPCIKALITEIRQVQCRKKYSRFSPMTPREDILLTIPPFLDYLTLYQSPEKYEDFFCGMVFRQDNVDEISALLGEAKEDEPSEIVCIATKKTDKKSHIFFLELLIKLVSVRGVVFRILVSSFDHTAFVILEEGSFFLAHSTALLQKIPSGTD